MSQPAFAALVGTTKKTLIDWEAGRTSPTAVQLSAFYNAVGIDVLYVITGERTSRFADIAERLVVEKTRLGMNTQYMAEAGGVTTEDQKSFERGETRPPAEYLNRLASHGVETHWIFFGSEELDAVRDKSRPQYTPEIRAFIENYQNCKPSIQIALRTMAEEAAQQFREEREQFYKTAPVTKVIEDKPKTVPEKPGYKIENKGLIGQQIVHNEGKVLLEETQESAKQDSFFKRTGIWCVKPARDWLESLLWSGKFDVRELRSAWKHDYIKWDVTANAPVYPLHRIEIVFAYSFFLLALLLLLLSALVDKNETIVCVILFVLVSWHSSTMVIHPRRIAKRIDAFCKSLFDSSGKAP